MTKTHAHLDQLDLLEILELTVNPVIQESQVQKENLVSEDHVPLLLQQVVDNAHLDQRDQAVRLEHPDQSEQKVQSAKMEPLAKMAHLGIQVLKVLLEHQDRMVKTVQKDLTVKMAKVGPKVNPDRKVQQVHLDHKDLLETLVPTGRMEALALQVQQEESADQANLLRSVDLVILVNRAFLEKMLNIVLAHGGPNWLRKPRLKN